MCSKILKEEKAVGRTPVVNRNRIIGAARKLFTRYGFSKTTVEDIGKALNAGKSSLYYHFKDKDEIFKTAIDLDITAIKKSIERELAGLNTPQDKLKAYVLLRMKKVKEFSGLYSTFKDEYQKNYSIVQKIRAEYDQFEISLIRNILSAGVKRGFFSVAADMDLASAAIFSAIKGMEYDLAINVDPSSCKRELTALLDILLYGIMKDRRIKP
jgi:AcrR family transcriptional regulator